MKWKKKRIQFVFSFRKYKINEVIYDFTTSNKQIVIPFTISPIVFFLLKKKWNPIALKADTVIPCSVIHMNV